MRIVIAGGHGKVALILERLLAEAGHEPVAIIRNPDHRADVDARGAAAVVLDLEAASVDEVAQVLKNADAAVFAAGAGPGSGAERKFTVDRDAAILLADAAEAAGAGTFARQIDDAPIQAARNRGLQRAAHLRPARRADLP